MKTDSKKRIKVVRRGGKSILITNGSFIKSNCLSDYRGTGKEDFLKRLENKKSKTEAVDSIVLGFLQNTTIPGLSHFHVSKGWCARSLWLAIIFAGIVVSFYQSYILLQEYNRCSVTEQSRREAAWEIEFPSVTVCCNDPMKWMSNINDPVAKLIANKINNLSNATASRFSEIYDPKEKIFLETLASQSEKDRLRLGYAITDFLLICKWRNESCSKNLTFFNNLYYGNCFTFNSGFDTKKLYSKKGQSLVLTLNTSLNDSFPYLIRENGISLLIHQPGTPPTLDRLSLWQINKGQKITIGITQTIYERLPAPYTSECVDKSNLKAQRNNLHFRDNSPYLYTWEACVESCFQRKAMQWCNCFNPSMPFSPEHPRNICLHEHCHGLNENENDAICNCKRPCRETTYSIDNSIDSKWYNRNSNGITFDAMLKSSNLFDMRKSIAGVEIYVANTFYETVYEEPKIKSADLLGAIGGIISLWVGISMMTIVELIYLASRIVMVLIKSFFDFE